MIKISCVIVDDEPVAREILVSFVANIPNLELLKSCKNAMEAFEVSTTQKVDLFFLDINMPEVSGLSLAKTINKKSKIIFTTAYREYALDGFDLEAVDYLLKPISFERFLQAVNKLFDVSVSSFEQQPNLQDPLKANFIFIRSDRKMIKLIFDDILYVESLSDYIKIHTKEKVLVTRETISNIDTKLPASGFLRIHRSFIVSVDKINSYTNEFVEVAKKALPISRSYKEMVLKKLSNH